MPSTTVDLSTLTDINIDGTELTHLYVDGVLVFSKDLVYSITEHTDRLNLGVLIDKIERENNVSYGAAVITIEPGIDVYSSKTSSRAFTTGYLKGKKVKVINKGRIIGCAGIGGYGRPARAGTALDAREAFELDNSNGEIYGGAGAGGGGGAGANGTIPGTERQNLSEPDSDVYGDEEYAADSNYSLVVSNSASKVVVTWDGHVLPIDPRHETDADGWTYDTYWGDIDTDGTYGVYRYKSVDVVVEKPAYGSAGGKGGNGQSHGAAAQDGQDGAHLPALPPGQSYTVTPGLGGKGGKGGNFGMPGSAGSQGGANSAGLGGSHGGAGGQPGRAISGVSLITFVGDQGTIVGEKI